MKSMGRWMLAGVLVVSGGLMGCSGSGGADGASPISGEAALIVAEVPASPATTRATGIEKFQVTKAGDTYVTRGVDATGTVVVEMSLACTRDEAGRIASIAMSTPVEGGSHVGLVARADGTIVENTFATAPARTIDALRAIHTDLASRAVPLTSSSNDVAYMNATCGVSLGAAILGGFACGASVGLGCLGAVLAVTNAIHSCG